MPDLAAPVTGKRDLPGFRSWRRQAAELFSQGASPATVAARLGISAQSAGRWRENFEQEGPAALGQWVKPGRPFRLSPRRLRELREIIARRPSRLSRIHRIRSGWTPKALREFIRHRYGIDYHVTHCWRLLTKWS
jgi:transposase